MASSDNAGSTSYTWLSPTFIISSSCDSCCSLSQIGANNAPVVTFFIPLIPQNRPLKNLGNYNLCHRRLDIQMYSTACSLFTLACSTLLVECSTTALKRVSLIKVILGFLQKKIFMMFFTKSVETKMENQKLLEDGENRLFLLSLAKERKTTSEHLKIDAKFDKLNIF